MKSLANCAGTSLANVVVGTLESIPIVGLIVKNIAYSSSDPALVAEITDSGTIKKCIVCKI